MNSQALSRIFVFPGQGSQQVGMGRVLAENFTEAREVFEEVDDALGQALSRVMWEGGEAELTLTANAQPAIMAVSLACWRVLEKQGGITAVRHAAAMAGHSLGEYGALTAAGALKLADTARLLRRRGEAMQQAVPEGQGAMAAILGLDVPAVESICKAAAARGDVCEIANDNSAGQVVISGAASAVNAAMEAAKEQGAKRCVPLPVSAPFHCSLMQPAAEVMEKALAETKISVPAVPVVANVTVEPQRDPEVIRRNLVAQVTGRVRWRETMEWMVAEGVGEQVELGNGKVLTGLAKRALKDAALVSLDGPEAIEAWLKTV